MKNNNLYKKLIAHELLSYEEAVLMLSRMTRGEFSDAVMASILTIYMLRSPTVEELTGFRDALIEACVEVRLTNCEPIDLCGTGGDGKDTFNISTLAAFVVAGAGIKVAKHGNYGVSSVCGSSNVLEYLGVKFEANQDGLMKQLDRTGITFLHAPLFHPALKNVSSVRKALGVKTFFNMLGPLVNPVRPKHQLVGVYSLEMARIYHYLLQNSSVNYTVVHALDGYDEVALTADVKVISKKDEQILNPSSFLASRCKPSDLKGGSTIKEAAQIFINVLDQKGTNAQNEVVCANAALAIKCYYPELQLTDAMSLSRESLRSGKALSAFKSLIN